MSIKYFLAVFISSLGNFVYFVPGIYEKLLAMLKFIKVINTDYSGFLQAISNILNIGVVYYIYSSTESNNRKKQNVDYSMAWYSKNILPKILPVMDRAFSDFKSVWGTDCLSLRSKYDISSYYYHIFEEILTDISYFNETLASDISENLELLQDEISDFVDRNDNDNFKIVENKVYIYQIFDKYKKNIMSLVFEFGKENNQL